jgi:hypothetical protein
MTFALYARQYQAKMKKRRQPLGWLQRIKGKTLIYDTKTAKAGKSP